MSTPSEENKDAIFDFQWKKKRGVGGKNKEIQFYESFTLDGVHYNLYDDVYFYKDEVSQPYIGKLIKIWELPNNLKKVKVLWFFCPFEISNWFKEKTEDKELFLASGEGKGLTNINPLEVICGKCNVVCTSKDSRNPQPSNEDIKEADYIFYRTFDVGSCEVIDRIAESIASTDAKFLLNRKEMHSLKDPVVDLELKERTSSQLDDRPSKKAKLESSSCSKDNIVKTEADLNGNAAHLLKVELPYGDKEKSEKSADISVPVHGLNQNKKMNQFMEPTSDAPSPQNSPEDDEQIRDGELIEVTRRPKFEGRSTWFREPSWEDKLSTGLKQDSVVLLQNLDSSYTSSEVEDIVWHAFRESCTAKMVQRVAISSPENGQAIAVFRSKEVVNFVLKKLTEQCLMLSNGRPLVAAKSTSIFLTAPTGGDNNSSGRSERFVGHLSIDKLKLIMQQRADQQEAVSTSHCSQPNTIEYEMALDWCLYQARADHWWSKLHKAQMLELKKLEAKASSILSSRAE